MAAQCHVDHSGNLLSRLLKLVNTETCDVTFVVIPSSPTAAADDDTLSTSIVSGSQSHNPNQHTGRGADRQGTAVRRACGNGSSTRSSSSCKYSSHGGSAGGKQPGTGNDGTTSFSLSRKTDIVDISGIDTINININSSIGSLDSNNCSKSKTSPPTTSAAAATTTTTTTTTTAAASGVLIQEAHQCAKANAVSAIEGSTCTSRHHPNAGGGNAGRERQSAEGRREGGGGYYSCGDSGGTGLRRGGIGNSESENGIGIETLRASSREFRCHRFLFASCSEYFRVLLYGGMSEAQTMRVELKDVTPEGFDAIVTYVYTGRVLVTAENVMEIFSLAHRFDMADLLRACAEVLDECMNCDDVCRVLEAAEYYGHSDLVAKCWELIKDSTPRVLKSEGFLELSLPILRVLVLEGELQVDEAELFLAVKAWVDRDPPERRPHMDEELSPHFRLPLISLRGLMSMVRPSTLVPAELLLDAVAYHSDPQQWSGDPIMIRPRGRRFSWDASSLAAGAWTADDDKTVTTSVGDWVGVYGNRVISCGFHRWSVRANKLGHHEKKTSLKAIIGIAQPQSQDLSRPYLPVTGFVVGTGESKLGGNTAVDDYSSVSLRDGDMVTVVYNADTGSLVFLVNGGSLGEAYSGLSGPVVAALAVNSAGAMWSLDWEV